MNEWLLEYYYPIGSKVKFNNDINILNIKSNMIGTISSHTYNITPKKFTIGVKLNEKNVIVNVNPNIIEII